MCEELRNGGNKCFANSIAQTDVANRIFDNVLSVCIGDKVCLDQELESSWPDREEGEHLLRFNDGRRRLRKREGDDDFGNRICLDRLFCLGVGSVVVLARFVALARVTWKCLVRLCACPFVV
ncbi:hypothetical protein LY76DRAFT_426401 [Colletotrichum caudatum]|nr:hypothetical protein LY76DRAFT_426401 [Colletotrichum caudatum]